MLIVYHRRVVLSESYRLSKELVVHQINEIINAVDKTHLGLGKAIAFSIICIKARQCLLLVAPSGCGKSVITDTLGAAHPDAIRLLSITRARLSDYKDTFSNFHGVVLMDDIAGAGSMYERKDTISSFCQLCYSHAISKHTWTVSYEITEFHGAAIINTQPALLAEIYEYPEWEGLMQEKTLRYYHLYRPTKPNQEKLKLKVDWGIDMDLVHKPKHTYKLYNSINSIASIQWSDSRALEHVDNLLKSIAALDRRQEVNNDDLLLLYKLMKPMTVERHIFRKSGFETGRWMDSNLAAVLVEFASWKNINVDRIARDYKVSPSTVYRLLADIKEWFVESQVQAKMLIPKDALKKVLKEAGVER
jgi:energy-coupling factor transporter ATP-binding protein EcfA2